MGDLPYKVEEISTAWSNTYNRGIFDIYLGMLN
jgi:hypothetical protein